MLPAGKRDRRIRLERNTPVLNDLNEGAPGWALLATVWAEVLPVSDGERARAGGIAGDITTRFRIAYAQAWANLNPKDRIVFDGRTLDILGVKEIGRREGLEISAAARGDT